MFILILGAHTRATTNIPSVRKRTRTKPRMFQRLNSKSKTNFKGHITSIAAIARLYAINAHVILPLACYHRIIIIPYKVIGKHMDTPIL